jgi:purine-nucleoside phosphorylase
MTLFITLEQIDQAADAVRRRSAHQPRVGIILGSGLNDLADSVQKADVIPYGDLPNWPISTVYGHAGRLVMGELEGQTVFIMQGRIHFYEGYSMSQITLPVRVMQRLGIESMIVTNAAGGVNPNFTPGDVMLITDNLNLIGMMGMNPLMGPNIDELGPRFPDMSQAYDRELMEIARKAASQNNIALLEGVYCALSGPSFEGPADLRFLRLAGADAVGMSTVPEVIVARHGGLRVLGFSGISNKANLDGSTVTTHEEVIEAGKVIAPKVEKILRGVLRSL